MTHGHIAPAQAGDVVEGRPAEALPCRVTHTGPWITLHPGRPSLRSAPEGVGEPPGPSEAREARRFRASERRWLRALALAVPAVVGLSVFQADIRHTATAFSRGEIDLTGNPVYEPPHPVPAGAVERIDMDQVNGELIPIWVIALGHVSRGAGPAEAAVAFGDLRLALGPDPNLVALFDELDLLLRADPVEAAPRIDYLLWAYNEYLDRHHIPWRLEANLRVRRRGGAILSTRSYLVLSDLGTEDGQRLRLLRRVDGTNVIEGFMGHTSRPEDGAMVILDRVLHFAVRHVWPLLHPGLDARHAGAGRSFAPFVRREALAALPLEQLKLLGQTAVDQVALLEVAESIHARHECGSRFQVWGLPYNGLPHGDRVALRDALERSADGDCPEVTMDEAARMIGASERLGATDGLEHALETLTTWLAQGISTHELQHLINARSLACPTCAVDDVVMDELAAYLSSFAAPSVGYASLLQACHQRDRGGRGPGQRALDIALDRLMPRGCSAAPPDDLYAESARLFSHLFESQPRARLSASFPSRLPVLPRDGEARYARR